MHIKSLDGLRGFAALWVCLVHFSGKTELFPNAGDAGKLGVAIFFVLSGFLMGALYFNRTPTASAVGEFFRRRAARVLPLYFVVVAVSFAFMMTAPDLWPYGVRTYRLADHLFLIKGTHVLWTIPIEIHFYLLFPLFWAARHKLGDRAVWVFLGLLAVFYLLPAYPMRWIYGSWHWFVVGLVVACLPHRSGPLWNVGFIAALAGLFLLPPGGELTDETILAMWRSPVSVIVIATLLVCTIRAPLAQSLLGTGPMAYLGKISYSLYLLHFVVLHLLLNYTALEGWVLFTAFAVGSLAVSHASHELIEQPARRFFTDLRINRVRTAKAT